MEIKFSPLGDLILVRPDPTPEMIGSIAIPQGVLQSGEKAGPSEDCFTGTVVAIGPGDRHKPFESVRCSGCHRKRHYQAYSHTWACACGHIFHIDQVEAWDAGRHPMLIKVGDRVAFPRRPSMPGGEFQVHIDGEMFMMFHEEQFAVAVIEEAEEQFAVAALEAA